MKPKVYIETSVVSYFTAWPSRDVANASKLALVERVCRECGYEPPGIATPSELMEV